MDCSTTSLKKHKLGIVNIHRELKDIWISTQKVNVISEIYNKRFFNLQTGEPLEKRSRHASRDSVGSVNEEVHQLIGGRIVGQPIYIQIKRSDDGTASNRRCFFCVWYHHSFNVWWAIFSLILAKLKFVNVDKSFEEKFRANFFRTLVVQGAVEGTRLVQLRLFTFLMKSFFFFHLDIYVYSGG